MLPFDTFVSVKMVELFSQEGATRDVIGKSPNKALQLTTNPLRGLSAAERGRYVGCSSLLQFERSRSSLSRSGELVVGGFRTTYD